MHYDNSRRLTGPNLYTALPGAVVEVRWDAGETDATAAIAAWRREARRMLDAVGWRASDLQVRPFKGGAAFFFSAPIDLLMPATDLNEWAIASATGILAGGEPAPLEPGLAALLASIEEARWPGLEALAEEASRRGVLFLHDDDGCTVGAGASMRCYARGAALPAPTELDWSSLRTLTIGRITGTNGKTTCSRLVTRIARLAGRRVGTTSTQGILLEEQFLERGDCSGPAGARTVLRHPEVELAVLETARGGILRRGLALRACDAALLTNVTVDHLGDYGIDDVPTLAQVKAVVGDGARTVVLNANDPELVALASRFEGRIVYFALDADQPALAAHRAQGGEAWFLRDGTLSRARGGNEQALVAEAEVPLTFGGLARYNTENALASAALASALGIADDAIVAGLRSFTSSQADNPGRGNQLELDGVQVLLDFGHNIAAVRAVLALARGMAGDGEVFVTVGMAGDRADAELAGVAREIAVARPRAVYLRELLDYLRGRALGEVPAILRTHLLAAGMKAANVRDAESELDALQRMMAQARAGDVVVVLLHFDAAVQAWLTSQGARTR